MYQNSVSFETPKRQLAIEQEVDFSKPDYIEVTMPPVHHLLHRLEELNTIGIALSSEHDINQIGRASCRERV